MWTSAVIDRVNSDLVLGTLLDRDALTSKVTATIGGSELLGKLGMAACRFRSVNTLWTADEGRAHWVVVQEAIFLSRVASWALVRLAFAFLDRAAFIVFRDGDKLAAVWTRDRNWSAAEDWTAVSVYFETWLSA